MCNGCGTTHAVIPCFSLPGTSIGTEEAEEYLHRRAEGMGRGSAGKNLQRRGMMSEKYPCRLDQMFLVSVDRAKALFPFTGDSRLNGMEWVKSVVEEPARPLYSLNCFCLEHGVNAVCCTRASILVFRARKSGGAFSHNLGTLQRGDQRIHSP